MPDLSKMQRLKRESLPEIVYENLCDLILQGGITPGQSVTVASLSEVLGVSPMPIREAMSRLMNAGALTKVSGRSMGVPRLDFDEMTDLKNVRCEIESRAVAWATEKRTKAFITSLEKILKEMIIAEKAADNPRFINLNHQFHFAIYEQSGSPLMLKIIRNLWLRISPYFHLLDAKGHLKISNSIHRSMLSAIEAGNAAEAQALLVQDITKANDRMVAFLAEENEPGYSRKSAQD